MSAKQNTTLKRGFCAYKYYYSFDDIPNINTKHLYKLLSFWVQE